jgi:hypothetical protein
MRVDTRGEDSHAKVWTALKASNNPIERSAGMIGDRIKKARTEADYDGRVTINRRVALNAIDDATKVIEKVDQAKRSNTLN